MNLCWLGHKWSRWGNVLPGPYLEGAQWVQTRYCLRCCKAEAKTIYFE